MAESIIRIIASLLELFVTLKIDSIVGKWVAYFTIAWENFKSEKAKTAFNDAMTDFKEKSLKNAGTWDEWRKSKLK